MNQLEVPQIVESVHKHVANASQRLLDRLACDNGGELDGGAFDVFMDRLLYQYLIEDYPRATWFSEESWGSEEDENSRLAFIVDPIDGTYALAERRADYGISVAVAIDRKIVGGVTALPRKDIVVSAFSNSDLRCTDTVGNPIVRTHEDSFRQLLVSPGRLRQMGEEFFRSAASGLEPVPVAATVPKVLPVCMGFACASVFLPLIGSVNRYWDYAASTMIAARSGVRLIDFDGKSLSDLSHGQVNSRGFICGRGGHVDQLRQDFLQRMEIE